MSSFKDLRIVDNYYQTSVFSHADSMHQHCHSWRFAEHRFLFALFPLLYRQQRPLCDDPGMPQYLQYLRLRRSICQRSALQLIGWMIRLSSPMRLCRISSRSRVFFWRQCSTAVWPGPKRTMRHWSLMNMWRSSTTKENRWKQITDIRKASGRKLSII